jgi:hypothetical protein
VGVAEVLRRGDQQQRQQALVVLVQQRRPSPARLVRQCLGTAGRGVGGHPLVDGLAGDAEHAGDVGGRPPEVELQDGQGAAEEAGVGGLRELAAEPLALPGCQVAPAHALASGQRREE